MAPSVYGARSWHETSSVTTTNVLVPTGLANLDEWWTAIVSDPTGQTFGFPGGGVWSKLVNDATYSTGGTVVAAHKTAGASESDAAVSQGTSERSVGLSWGIADGGSINASATPNTGSGTTATFPALDTTVDGCLLLRLLAVDGDYELPTLSGWTREIEHNFASAGSIALYSKTQTTQGNEASADVTITSDQWFATTWAIEPGVQNITDSVTLAIFKGITESATKTVPGSLSLSSIKAISESGQANTQAVVFLSLIRDLTESGQADAQGILPLALLQAISALGSKITTGSVDLARGMAITVSGQQIVPGAVNLDRVLALSAAAINQAQGYASLQRASALSANGQADRQASLLLSLIRQIQPLGAAVADGGLLLTEGLGVTTAGYKTVPGDLALDRIAALVVNGQKGVFAEVNLDRSHAIGVGAYTIAYSVIGLGKILQIVILDEFSQFVIVVPLKRKAIVEPETRIFTAESRPYAVMVEPENRVYIVS